MSNLTQFAPFAGGGLKSFQTGYVSVLTASSGTGEDTRNTNVTVSSVNTSKAVPGFDGSAIRNDLGGAFACYFFATGAQGSPAIVLPRLTTSTNLRLSVNFDPGAFAGVGVAIGGRWQVAEAN